MYVKLQNQNGYKTIIIAVFFLTFLNSINASKHFFFEKTGNEK